MLDVRRREERHAAAAAAAFLLPALLLGGAGAAYPRIELALAAMAAALLSYHGLRAAPPARETRAALLLAGLVLLLPALQLVPLPPEIWTALPGRGQAAEAAALVGAAERWRPLSLDPAATARAVPTLLAAAAGFLVALRAPPPGRSGLVAILLAAAAAGTMLEALQIASGGAAAVSPFATEHRGYGVGLFVNRNHQAALLLVALVLGAAYARTATPRIRPLVWALNALFAAGVLATTSRMGLFLLLLAIPAAAAVAGLRPPRGKRGYAAAAAALAAAAAVGSGAVQAVLARAPALADGRFAFWSDTLAAISAYWPLGTGLGTFPAVHPTFESLAAVAPEYVNHAHNDALELLLEGGAPAALLLLAFVWIFSRRAWALWRRGGSDADPIGRAASAAILLLLLYSLVDYPLRMAALAAVFGLSCGLMLPAPEPAAPKMPRRPALLAAVAALGALAGYHALAPSGGGVPHARAALAAGDHRRAAALAAEAAARAPLNSAALSTLALARAREGAWHEAHRLMDAASALGWRDVPAQLWVLGAALEQGEMEVAMQRADALLRQRRLAHVIIPLLRRSLAREGAVEALAVRLAERPAWRRAFLHDVAALAPAEAQGLATLHRALVRTAAPPAPGEVAPLVERLIRLGRAQEGKALWRDAAGGGQGLLSNGGFDRQGNHPDPFGWTFPGLRGAVAVFAAPDGPNSGTALKVGAQAGVAGILVRQRLVLPPGSYHFSVTRRGSGEGLEWRLGCGARTGEAPLPLKPVPARQGTHRASYRLDVPAACPDQILELAVDASGGGVVETWFDAAEIVPER